MLTKYGLDNIIVMLLTGLLLIIIPYFTSNMKVLNWVLYSLGGFLIIFTFVFFRDPDRTIPSKVLQDESYIIAPADGKVVNIEDEFEKYYLKSDSKRISIFLSPIDVHVNRTPAKGVVDFYEYFEGDYLVAYHPKSSELNEHSRIGVLNKYGKVYFKQIVGVLARRIVCDVKVGDTLEAGDKIGMMKFGSRMDIAISPESEIYVKVGDRVVAGETIIARLPKKDK
jgi:phosphatidylserine decarboxylase